MKQFENNFKEYIGCDDVIAVSSGTAALHLALSLHDIKGKEVILPSLSFVSTANAILYNGGIPVFADIEEDTLCIAKQGVIANITENTAAIIHVHFGGFPCSTSESSIPIIQDAAHASGAIWKDGKVGSHGIACFSFHPVKNLAMPKGGVITLNNIDKEDIAKLKARRWCGITDRKGMEYDVKEIGWNYYMDEISAAIGIEQLKKLDYHNKRRYEIAKQYHKELYDPRMPLVEGCAYHLYWITVGDRKQFIKKMLDNDIQVGIHYTPIDQFSLYKKADLPVTDRIAKHIVSLPIHAGMSDDDVTRVIKCANS